MFYQGHLLGSPLVCQALLKINIKQIRLFLLLFFFVVGDGAFTNLPVMKNKIMFCMYKLKTSLNGRWI